MRPQLERELAKAAAVRWKIETYWDASPAARTKILQGLEEGDETIEDEGRRSKEAWKDLERQRVKGRKREL